MSKAVMLSIRPKWCEKIINGEKTIEVRKTRPKLHTPFKCYIYCTSGYLSYKCPHGMVCHCNGGREVIGEFTCDRIDWITHVGYMGVPGEVDTCICDAVTMHTSPIGGLLNAACLTPKMLDDYLAGNDGYGWHITNLRIYDAPKCLFEFWAERLCRREPSVFGCGECCDCDKRPPQSWCYVEAMENG